MGDRAIKPFGSVLGSGAVGQWDSGTVGEKERQRNSGAVGQLDIPTIGQLSSRQVCHLDILVAEQFC